PAFEYDQSPRHASGRSSLEFGRRSAVWERSLPTLAPPESDGASRSSRSAAREAVNHFVIDAIRNGVSVSTGPSAASSIRSPTSSPAATAGTPVRARASRTISANCSCGIALAMPLSATLPRDPGPARATFLVLRDAAPWAEPEVANRKERALALTKEAKQEIITKHGRDAADTGSPQVQIAMLTQ